MIGYVTVGSNNLPAALSFYDALLQLVGGSELMPHPSGGRVYGAAPGAPLLAVVAPANGEPAVAGNGAMIALAAETRGQVDALHAKALELGGACEGQPGVRGDDPDGFYGAYFRDLDGNKLCAFRFGPA